MTTAAIIVVQLILLLFAAVIAGMNAARSRRAIRLFWALLGAALGMWALNLWFWTYYVVWLRSSAPDYSKTVLPLFLHIVLIIAAVAVRPHLKRPNQNPYRATFDFLLLLFFWVFLYAFLQLPYEHTKVELGYFLLLYYVPNVVLLVFLGWLMSRAHPPWKVLYRNLFGASALYALGSLGSNLDTFFHGYRAGYYEALLIVSECWFVWVTLLGWRMAPELEQRLQADTGYTKWYVSILAMLAVVAIPVVGLWELVRMGEPAEVRKLRLLIVLASVLLLTLSALIKEYLEHHDLVADLSTAISRRTQVEEERLKLSGRLIHAQEEERSRMARDLHDDLNQRLGLLAFGLASISKRLPDEEANQIQQLWEQATDLSKLVHRLSHELHPSALEHLGLGGAARALCDEVSKQKRVNIEFSEKDIPVQLPPDMSLCLFRILQEGLNNICKHSHASNAWVKLRRVRDGIRLTVRDDGIGFDPNDEHSLCGLGLLSMNERLRLVGGRIAIDSLPSKGTTVRAWVAINAGDALDNGSAIEQLQSSRRPHRRKNDEPHTGTLG